MAKDCCCSLGYNAGQRLVVIRAVSCLSAAETASQPGLLVVLSWQVRRTTHSDSSAAFWHHQGLPCHVSRELVSMQSAVVWKMAANAMHFRFGQLPHEELAVMGNVRGVTGQRLHWFAALAERYEPCRFSL